MEKLKVLDLFSGIGGFSLGLERTGGFETVAFCEIDPFCQKVLKKHWPNVPIYNDVRNLEYDGAVDVITGGFPCQPFSVAGKRKGAEDDRHLWPAMFNLIKKYRPTWVIGENVAGLINMGLDDVLADLESEAYTTRTFVIPACAVGAPHRRDRVWIVGYSEHYGSLAAAERGKFNKTSGNNTKGENKASEFAGASQSKYNENLADTNNERLQRREKTRNSESGWKIGKQFFAGFGGIPRARWSPEPAVGRVANGIPRRVDRLKSLGNAVVPQIPEMIGYAILEAERLT